MYVCKHVVCVCVCACVCVWHVWDMGTGVYIPIKGIDWRKGGGEECESVFN